MRTLFDPIFDAAGISRFFTDAALLSAMLAFERALAEAEVEVGLVPARALDAIRAASDPALYDPGEIGRNARDGANPAIPLVAALRARVHGRDPEAACFVHFGATSQDVIDTALTLCAREALDALLVELDGLVAALAERAAEHRTTVRVARTLLQQALPTTLGYELSLVVDGLLRCRRRLLAARHEDLVVQFGGAAGTFSLLGEAGPQVARALARRLGLAAPEVPWHTVRDRRQHLAALLAETAGIAAKWLTDVALSAQSEMAELAEPAATGRGGSSTLPHKRNPVACVRARAAFSRLAGPLATLHGVALHEFERAAGAWHAEWHASAEVFVLTGAVLAEARTVARGLVVDRKRMRENLERGNGLVYAEALRAALEPALGARAPQLVEELAREAAARGAHLRDLARLHSEVCSALPPATLERVFDPLAQLAAALTLTDAVVARARRELAAASPGEEKDDGRA